MPDSDGRARLYSAQWNHQMAHLRELPDAEPCSLHARVDQKTEIVSRMLGIGFGGISKAANEADEVDCHAPPTAFVSFLQTHDLVGNDLLGQRIYAKAPVHAVRALSSIYLLVPQIPMLFMGDEWGASTPFPFFCDYEGDTGQRAREGRMKFLQKTCRSKGGSLFVFLTRLRNRPSAVRTWTGTSSRRGSMQNGCTGTVTFSKFAGSRLSPC